MLTEKPPPSPVLSGWFGTWRCITTGHRIVCQCTGPVGFPPSSALLNHKHLSCSTSTNSSSNCTWSIPSVLWMVGHLSPRDHRTFNDLSMNWFGGIAIVFCTTCVCVTCSTCSTRISLCFFTVLQMWRLYSAWFAPLGSASASRQEVR